MSNGEKTIQIVYNNSDWTQRYGNVVVNGVSNIVAFAPTRNVSLAGESIIGVTIVRSAMRRGQNEIRFEGVGGLGKSPNSMYNWSEH